MRSKNSNKGQTIVEAVVALASIMLTLAAIAVVITTSLSNSTFLQDQSLASKYSQEGMELMRYERNTNTATFETRQGIYCLNQDGSLDPGSCLGVNIDNSFIREVEFTQGSTECAGGVHVAVNVYYSSGKCPGDDRFCHTAALVTCFAVMSGAGTEL